MVVIGVELRDPAGGHGPQRHLADLSDCAEVLAWAHARRATLGLSSLIVAGQSGGANLALATTLRAKRAGRLGVIDGVYALAVHLGRLRLVGAHKFAHLPSLLENDGYVVNSGALRRDRLARRSRRIARTRSASLAVLGDPGRPRGPAAARHLGERARHLS